jgi:hypothetical protein
MLDARLAAQAVLQMANLPLARRTRLKIAKPQVYVSLMIKDI